MTVADLSMRAKYGVLVLCGLPFILVTLDGTVVNVALPTIARELDADLQSLQWMVGAYVLVLSALVLFAGTLADRIGRKRVVVIGLAIFVPGSILCSLATSEEWLIGARAFQAIGGAMISPAALALVTNVFTGPGERAKAIGWWAALGSVGLAAGPILGGFLVDSFGWRSIFWINVLPGILVIILLLVKGPESKADKPRAFDPVGQIVMIVFLAALTFGIIEVPDLGLGSPIILGAFVVAAIALVALVLYERRRPEALVPITLFTNRAFTVAVSTLFVGVLGLAALLFMITLYLQNGRGLTPLQAGLMTAPMAITAMIVSPLVGRIVAAGHARATLIASGALIVLAAVGFSVTQSLPLWTIIVPFVLFGAGFGALNDPVNVIGISQLPNAQAGLAASLISTGRQFGQAMGVAVVGVLMAGALGGSLTKGYADATTPVHILVGITGVVIIVLNALVAPRVAASGPVQHPTP